MARILLILIVVFLVPFFLYRLGYAVFGANKGGPNWLSAPLGFLAFMGAVLGIAAVVLLQLWTENQLDLSWLGL